jgi:hypothetical protein
LGRFGIQVAGTGPGDYTKTGELGADAEAAIAYLLDELKRLGFEIVYCSILAPKEEETTP